MRWTLLTLMALQFTLPVCELASATHVAPSFGARLADFKYPFEVKFFELKSQRQRLEMAYMHVPANEGRPTALLLHGKNFNGAYWRTTARHLTKFGWGVLIPDQIGFGKSSKPTSYQYSFNQLASNTRKLLKAVSVDEVAVIGHSMGGMLAARFALAYPDVTAHLVLVNPIGLEDYLDYTTYPTLDEAFNSERNLTPEAIITYQKENYYDGAWNDTYQSLTIPLRGWLRGPDRDQLAFVSALTYDMILTQPVVDDLPNLRVPTSLIIGTRDRTGPNRGNKRPGVAYELGRYDQLGKKTQNSIPGARLWELEHVGHLPHIEAFDRFSAALGQTLNLGK